MSHPTESKAEATLSFMSSLEAIHCHSVNIPLVTQISPTEQGGDLHRDMITRNQGLFGGMLEASSKVHLLSLNERGYK